MTSATSTPPDTPNTVERLLERYRATRRFTQRICQPLETEDYVVQSMPDVSPTRWHLAHTTWFLETFVLLPHFPGYQVHDESYGYLFNSYYNSVGPQFSRRNRGLLTRPTVARIWEYRAAVDDAVQSLLERNDVPPSVCDVLELGIQHEQQHQELIVTDIKHVLSCNPCFPVYRAADETDVPGVAATPTDGEWLWFAAQLAHAGYEGDDFCFDNELPRHRAYLHPFALQDRLVTNEEFLRFVNDQGYQRPELWLSMGWTTANEHQWRCPLYWRQSESGWRQFTLSGLQPLAMHEPVCHVSYFEADAYARWAGSRLPTEFEWERAAADGPMDGSFAESPRFQPAAMAEQPTHRRPRQMFGEVWQWTSSQYAPFPGYTPPAGAGGIQRQVHV